MAVLAQAMPVSTKDLHYDRRIPEACGRQTGDCLRVLLKRVQNQELVMMPMYWPKQPGAG